MCLQSLLRYGQLLCLLAMSATANAGLPPDQLIKATSEEVLTVLRADADIAAGNTSKVIDIVEAKVLPHFDFERMTRLAVGKNWRNASDLQRQSLTTAFRTLLVRTYAWLVLLQRRGLINNWGIELGLWDEPLCALNSPFLSGVPPMSDPPVVTEERPLSYRDQTTSHRHCVSTPTCGLGHAFGWREAR